MTTGKTIALTRRTFVGKVMSLLFNMLKEYYSAIKNETLPFATVWINLEGTVLNEISQTSTACYYLYVESKKK